MKRIMAFALTLCLLLSLVSPIPVAATQSADLIYKETVERALEEYGKLRFTESSMDCIATGVFKILLLDFNGDGQNELVIMHRGEDDGIYPTIDVWTVRNGQPQQIFSDKQRTIAMEPVSTVEIYCDDDTVYIPMYGEDGVSIELYGMEGGEFVSTASYDGISSYLPGQYMSDGGKITFADGRELREHTCVWFYVYGLGMDDYENVKADMQNTLREDMEESLLQFFTAYDYEGDWLWKRENSDQEAGMRLTATSDTTLLGDISFYRLFSDSLTIDFSGRTGTISSESGNFTGAAVFGIGQICLMLDDKPVYGDQKISELFGTTEFHFTTQAQETSLVEYGGASVEFSASLFQKPPYEYDNELAKLGAMLSMAAGQGEPNICDLFYQLGIEDDNISNTNYDNHIEIAGQKIGEGLAFSIAYRPIMLNGEETNLIFIVARGSQTWNEFAGDAFTAANTNFLGQAAYELVVKFHEMIWDAMLSYSNAHEDLYDKPRVFFITGHSLGGAAANLTAALANNPQDGNSWIFTDTDRSRIYAYTYGSIDSIFAYNSYHYPITNGYENIHNIYNFYDTFGPNGRDNLTASGNSGIGKFGHMDVFAYQFDWDNKLPEATNHIIENYLRAIVEGAVECKGVYSFSEIHCPVDVEVLKDGEVVGRITDNQVDESLLETHPDVTMMVVEDSKYIGVFGEQEGYSLRITATDDGEMTVSTTSFNEEGESYAAADYPSVKIDDGQAFSLSLLSPDTAAENDQTPELLVMNGDRVVGKVNADGSITNVGNIGKFAPYIIGAFASVIVIAAFIVVWSMRRKRKGSKNN